MFSMSQGEIHPLEGYQTSLKIADVPMYSILVQSLNEASILATAEGNVPATHAVVTCTAVDGLLIHSCYTKSLLSTGQMQLVR